MGIYHHANFQGNARGFGTKSLIKLQEKVDLKQALGHKKFKIILQASEKGDLSPYKISGECEKLWYEILNKAARKSGFANGPFVRKKSK